MSKTEGDSENSKLLSWMRTRASANFQSQSAPGGELSTVRYGKNRYEEGGCGKYDGNGKDGVTTDGGIEVCPFYLRVLRPFL